MGMAWSESKKKFMKKFGRRPTSPKLPVKLVPERDKAKWYEALFLKSPKSTAAGKYAPFAVDA